jgi:hypothetical protein
MIDYTILREQQSAKLLQKSSNVITVRTGELFKLGQVCPIAIGNSTLHIDRRKAFGFIGRVRAWSGTGSE